MDAKYGMKLGLPPSQNVPVHFLRRLVWDLGFRVQGSEFMV